MFGMMEEKMNKWLILAVGIVFNALANVLIKAGSNQIAVKNMLSLKNIFLIINPYLVGGIGSFAIALAAYSLALSKFKLSVAYPIMTSLGFIIVVIASKYLFGEEFNILKMVGIITTIIGVILISISQ